MSRPPGLPDPPPRPNQPDVEVGPVEARVRNAIRSAHAASMKPAEIDQVIWQAQAQATAAVADAINAAIRIPLVITVPGNVSKAEAQRIRDALQEILHGPQTHDH